MSFKLPKPESIELTDPEPAVRGRKLSGPECVQLCCQLTDDKRKENVQEFAALYPLEIDHPVFTTPFFGDLPADYSFEGITNTECSPCRDEGAFGTNRQRT